MSHGTAAPTKSSRYRRGNCIHWAVTNRQPGDEIRVSWSPLKFGKIRVYLLRKGRKVAFVPQHDRRYCGLFAAWWFNGRVVDLGKE
jgi:hypothetical protein